MPKSRRERIQETQSDLKTVFPQLSLIDGALGFSFSEWIAEISVDGGPVKWLKQNFVKFVAGMITSAAAFGGNFVLDLFEDLRGAVTDGASAVAESGSAILDPILLVVGIYGDVLSSVASVGGPASPIIYAVLVGLSLGLTLRLIVALAIGVADLDPTGILTALIGLFTGDP